MLRKQPHYAIINFAGRTGRISSPRKISERAGKFGEQHARVFRRFRSRFLPFQVFLLTESTSWTALCERSLTRHALPTSLPSACAPMLL
jgi:hypothetical protein